MPLACKYCIATNGLKGSEIDSLPKTEAELVEHIEREHHIAVRRDSETEREANERLRATYPGARDLATCKCPDCVERRRVLTIARN